MMSISVFNVPVSGHRFNLALILVAGLIAGTSCRAAKVSSEDRFDPRGAPPVRKGKDVLMLKNDARVGLRVMKVTATDKQGKTTTTDFAVWYPTPDEEKPFTYDYGKNKVQTRVALNAPVAKGRYPLIVHSHGATGTGYASTFICETLARHGFVVAAPDHTDDSFLSRIDPKKNPANGAIKAIAYATKVRMVYLGKKAVESRDKVSYRPAQLQAVIDVLEQATKDKSSPFYQRVDAGNVGLMGHSFGAWTAMISAGAVPAFHEPRAKALALLSAAVNESVFSPAEVTRIQIPTLIMFGSTEVKQGRGNDREHVFDHLSGPKYMVEVRGVDHVAFSGGFKHEYATAEEYLSKDARRAAITRYVTAFMLAHLKGDKDALKQLHLKGNSITNLIYED